LVNLNLVFGRLPQTGAVRSPSYTYTLLVWKQIGTKKPLKMIYTVRKLAFPNFKVDIVYSPYYFHNEP
jgi:hypothetical protein